jgi:hypothetical protein
MSRTHKSLCPRINEVRNHGNTKFNHNIRTNYDQMLWPIPGIINETLRQSSLPKKGKK